MRSISSACNAKADEAYGKVTHVDDGVSGRFACAAGAALSWNAVKRCARQLVAKKPLLNAAWNMQADIPLQIDIICTCFSDYANASASPFWNVQVVGSVATDVSATVSVGGVGGVGRGWSR